jgi:hypothetical protein
VIRDQPWAERGNDDRLGKAEGAKKRTITARRRANARAGRAGEQLGTEQRQKVGAPRKAPEHRHCRPQGKQKVAQVFQ